MNGMDKRHLSFIPVPALIVIIVALYLIIKPSVFFEPTWLLPIQENDSGLAGRFRARVAISRSTRAASCRPATRPLARGAPRR